MYLIGRQDFSALFLFFDDAG